MIKKIQDIIINLTVLFTLQTFLFVSMAFAQIDYFADSCLSPALNISALNFNQNFNLYFAQQTAVFKKPDTVKARNEFKNDLYALPFKSLFPRIIQYQLLNAINQELLSDLNNAEIIDMQVEYSSDDLVYQLFVQQGEKNLSSLIGNEELKQNLLPIKQTQKGEWIALEGYNPPSKYRAKPETIEKYKRKWLLDSIPGVSGYSKKELKQKAMGGLWKMYFQFKLSHEFGKRLLRDVKNNRSAEFKVNITLKDKSKIEAYISITGKNLDVAVNQIKGQVENKINSNNEVWQVALLSFDQRIEKIQDESFRQKMHILESQKKDLTNVVNAIEQLNDLLDAGLAYWNSEYNPDMAKQIKKELGEINDWLRTSKKTFNGKVTKKYQAYLALDKAVKKWGYLSHNNYASTARQIEGTLDFLNQRIEELIKGIKKRNELLFQFALESNDHFLLSEVLQNEALRIEAAIKIDNYDIAWAVSELIKLEYLNNSEFQKQVAKFEIVAGAISKLDRAISHAEEVYQIKKAINLINNVEGAKFQLANIQNDISKVKFWLVEEKGFNQLAKSAQEIINDLNMVKVDEKNYLSWIIAAREKINALIDQVENSKLNLPIKEIIIGKFAEPNRYLKKIIEQINTRNTAIRKVLPSVKLISVSNTLNLLSDKMDKKTNGLGFVGIKNQAIFEADILKKSVARLRQTDSSEGGLVRVGTVVQKLINKIQKPILVNQAI